ncbi:MAG: hypothetical protein ABIQ32_06775 [Sphingomicrobium sp.]
MAGNPDKEKETRQQSAPPAGQDSDWNEHDGRQGAASDDVLQDNLGQGDLAQQDALTQDNDDGMGEAAGEEDGR